MFLLQWLPNSILETVIFAILGVGFIATLVSIFFINPLLRLMPALAGTYRLIQLASVALFLLGIYLWGGYSTEMRWRDRVAAAEKAAKEAELKFEQTNAELGKVIAQRDHAVATRGKTIVQQTIKYLEGEPRTHTNTINLSEAERAKLERQIAELQRAEKQCPVPELVVNAINAASVLPVNKETKSK